MGDGGRCAGAVGVQVVCGVRVVVVCVLCAELCGMGAVCWNAGGGGVCVCVRGYVAWERCAGVCVCGGDQRSSMMLPPSRRTAL